MQNTGCDDGTYGDNCALTCGNCINDAPCDKTSGKCAGCEAGYYGEKCDAPCGNCKLGTCDSQTGSCLGGCAAGYEGGRCDQGKYIISCIMIIIY